MIDIWKYILTLIIGIIIGFFIGINNIDTVEVPIEIHDTINIESVRIELRTYTIKSIDTLYLVDTFIVKEDGTYVQLPVDYKLYCDEFITDSSKLSLKINYHGIDPKIDSILYVYDYTPTFKCPDEKKIRPFVGVLGGPSLNAGFREVNGMSVQIVAGSTFKGGWGFIGSYEIDGINSVVSHEVKVGVIKLF